MTWKIKKDKLIEGLDVLSLVPSQPGLPSSEYIRISREGGKTAWMVASTATGTVELKGNGKWPWKKDFFLDRRLFIPFVAAAKEIKSQNDFEFYANGKHQLVVRHGKRKVRFDVQPKVTGYGFPPKAKLLSELELTPHVRGLVHCARECAVNDVARPQLACVYLEPTTKEKVHIYATNRKIVYFGHSRAKLKTTHAIPIPLFLVTLLGQENLRAIHYKDKFMSLVFPHGIIWQPTSLKAAKGFPADKIYSNMKKVEDFDLVFTSSCKAFSKVLDRLSQYLASVRRQDWVLKIKGEKRTKKILLTCSVPTGTFHEVTIVTKIKKDFDMEWPLDMLLPVFEYIQKDKGQMKIYQYKKTTYVVTSDVKMAIPERES